MSFASIPCDRRYAIAVFSAAFTFACGGATPSGGELVPPGSAAGTSRGLAGDAASGDREGMAQPSPPWGGMSIYSLAAGAGRYVAVGGQGLDVPGGTWVSNPGAIYVSSDGFKWLASASGLGDALFGVAFGNGHFVAIGTETPVTPPTPATFMQPGVAAYLSEDAATWHRIPLPAKSLGPGQVAFGNGWFVLALGDDGGESTPTILRSQDGTTWEVVATPTMAPAPGTSLNRLSGVAFANGRFATWGQPVLTSVDAQVWAPASSLSLGAYLPVGSLFSPGDTFAGSTIAIYMVADVSLFGLVTSPDGLAWTNNDGLAEYPPIPVVTSPSLCITFDGLGTVLSGPTCSTTAVVTAAASGSVNPAHAALAQDGVYLVGGAFGIVSRTETVGWTVASR
jgi:hypothetical protein